MKLRSLLALVLAPVLGSCGAPSPSGDARRAIDAIDTVVVIYAENRSFDSFYGLYPGANGIPGLNPSAVGTALPQRDVDGAVLPVLPPVWGGLTAPGQAQVVTQAQTVGLANRPFQIDGEANGIDGLGIAVPTTVTTRDLVHRFYNNIMQIDGGRNDRFTAYSDAGGLSMGYYDGSRMALWKIARQYTLADNFFMGAFGGSFLNHQYLVCACIPEYPHADASPAKNQISAVEVDAAGGFVRLAPAANAVRSALDGPPRYRHDGLLTAKDAAGMYYAVNTMQPPYQPSGNEPAAGGDVRFADAAKATTMPPQALPTIGDRLDAKGVSWAWYGGAWKAASAGTPEARAIIYKGKTYFVAHHQPFNYFANFDPALHAAYRREHLRDFDSRFLVDAAAGQLPAVTFYKPQGNLNQHAGYANVADGDAHIAELIGKLQQGPQWPHMLIVVTYDENGGLWDHAPVPVGDRWGPGTRVPAIIVSPLAKKGFVDKTAYDT
ncbi:MAG: acid phosphatase, partial [Pseudomonadota bacterium]|nr:acid phosphatase [Pseudomonadota bacterium]